MVFSIARKILWKLRIYIASNTSRLKALSSVIMGHKSPSKTKRRHAPKENGDKWLLKTRIQSSLGGKVIVWLTNVYIHLNVAYWQNRVIFFNILLLSIIGLVFCTELSVETYGGGGVTDLLTFRIRNSSVNTVIRYRLRKF